MAQSPDDEIEQAVKMAAPPVDPHASLTAPIFPAPVNELGDPMGRTNELGDALPAQAEESPAPAKMSAQKQHISSNLMADYAKDNTPSKGFFGHLMGGLDAAVPGVMRQFRGTKPYRELTEEPQLEKRLGDVNKQESEQALQGAETAGKVGENENQPQKFADEHAQAGATTENIKSQTNERNHNVAMGPNLATAYAHRVNEVLKANGDPSTDPIVQHLQDAITSLQPGQNKAPEAPKTIQIEQGGKPHQMAFDAKTGKYDLDQGESGEKPPNVTLNQGTWSLQNDTQGKPILFNSKTGETRPAPADLARKPNAEELKRNDLSGNVNENLDKLEDIVSRRPELFGPVAGRMTKAKEMIGTSDPDVAALKTIEDNLGMALQSAHGMRSAQHVATSAESVLNGLKNSPGALSAAIKTARESVGTFQSDAQHTNDAGRSRGDAVAPKPGDVEDGYRFKGGDPKSPQSWEKQ